MVGTRRVALCGWSPWVFSHLPLLKLTEVTSQKPARALVKTEPLLSSFFSSSATLVLFENKEQVPERECYKMEPPIFPSMKRRILRRITHIEFHSTD